jgi:hypothetical protein
MRSRIAVSHFGVPHSGESTAQSKNLAREERVGALAFRLVPAAVPHAGWNVLEEVGGGDVKKIGELLQATGADPIRPFLVLLDLLEAEVYRRAHLGLAHAHHESAHSHSGSDIYVDRVWRFHNGTLMCESYLSYSRFTRNAALEQRYFAARAGR